MCTRNNQKKVEQVSLLETQEVALRASETTAAATEQPGNEGNRPQPGGNPAAPDPGDGPLEAIENRPAGSGKRGCPSTPWTR